MLSRYRICFLAPVIAGCLLTSLPAAGQEPGTRQSATTVSAAAAETRTELDAIGVRDKLARLPNAEQARGKPIPGEARTDMYAKLQVNPDLRVFLDFFVDLAETPQDQPAVEDLMMTVLERRGMRGHIRVQVLRVLQDYMPYRMAVREQGLASGDSGELMALRKKYLGEEQARLLF